RRARPIGGDVDGLDRGIDQCAAILIVNVTDDGASADLCEDRRGSCKQQPCDEGCFAEPTNNAAHGRLLFSGSARWLRPAAGDYARRATSFSKLSTPEFRNSLYDPSMCSRIACLALRVRPPLSASSRTLCGLTVSRSRSMPELRIILMKANNGVVS